MTSQGLLICSWRSHVKAVIDLCAEAQKEEDKTTRENFDPEWTDRPQALLNQLHRGLYDQRGADYFVGVLENKPVCAAGCYPATDLVIAGEPVSIVMSRMFTVREQRVNWLGTRILMRIAQTVKTPWCIVTFNQINHGLYTSMTSGSRGLNWPPIWAAFKPLGLHKVNHCPQWVAYARTQDLLEHVID